jgi:hypothetical protein
MSLAPFNFKGLADVAVPRQGGNTARIIRQTHCEAGPIATRVVMTETRKTTEGSDMPVCWAIVTRLYSIDADGWEELDHEVELYTEAMELEFAWDEAKENAVSMMRSAYEWFVFDDEKQEVSK